MVTVTGATGHIGNALARELISRKVAVRAKEEPARIISCRENRYL